MTLNLDQELDSLIKWVDEFIYPLIIKTENEIYTYYFST